jgi:hypothetical protein
VRPAAATLAEAAARGAWPRPQISSTATNTLRRLLEADAAGRKPAVDAGSGPGRLPEEEEAELLMAGVSGTAGTAASASGGGGGSYTTRLQQWVAQHGGAAAASARRYASLSAAAAAAWRYFEALQRHGIADLYHYNVMLAHAVQSEDELLRLSG